MTDRSIRRAAERKAKKQAQKQLRNQPQPSAAAVPPAPSTNETPAPEIASPAAEPLRVAHAAAGHSSPISGIQLAANRANAQLSTGPITESGRFNSARNNTRHGLSGETDGENFRVLLWENKRDYDQNLAEFRAEWKPVTATEHDLVNRMVMHRWLRIRALRMQEELFDVAIAGISDIKKFELYRRYETTHERAFNKAFADLQRLRAFQLRQQNGFESQKRKNEEHEFKMRRLKHKEEMEETGRRKKIATAQSQTTPQNSLAATSAAAPDGFESKNGDYNEELQ